MHFNKTICIRQTTIVCLNVRNIYVYGENSKIYPLNESEPNNQTGNYIRASFSTLWRHLAAPQLQFNASFHRQFMIRINDVCRCLIGVWNIWKPSSIHFCVLVRRWYLLVQIFSIFIKYGSYNLREQHWNDLFSFQKLFYLFLFSFTPSFCRTKASPLSFHISLPFFKNTFLNTNTSQFYL